MSILLSLRGITKVYGVGTTARTALKGVDLDIQKGEILGLLGVNGAGKTTLASIIATLNPPTSGTITLNSASIYDDVPAYRKIIGFCPQKPNVNPQLTIKQNLLFAGRFYGISAEETESRVAQLMKRFELETYAENYIDQLSGGYKQRFLIARALIHKPQLILFDEPTVALDPHVRHEVWDLLKELRSQGVTIVLTTHYLDEAEALSDRVCILDEGVIRLIDTPANLKSEHGKARLEDVFIKLINEKND
ncbi:ABC transporter ATP-binding protein [Candidatus Dependentiae bacterium]|nr:ABC transporter ATP-binding protein [Candidatus Dependentiae bacterium]